MTRAHFRKRLQHLTPWRGPAAWWWLVPLAIAALAAGSMRRHSFFAVLLLPLAAAVAIWVHGRILLLLARARSPELRCVILYSDSPHWKERIERSWAALGPGIALLDASRPLDERSLAFRIWRRFSRHRPSAVVLRGIRHPTVYRCYWAFQAAARGDEAPLRGLESALAAELKA